MTKQIVPFGKYKDQPIEVLAADKPYLDWMLAQSWFKDRYPELFTVVINNFQEPADTPEHNAMQMKFLDDGYVFNLLAPFVGFSTGRVTGKNFECDGWDVDVGLASIDIVEYNARVLRENELNNEIKKIDVRQGYDAEMRRSELYDEIEKLHSDVKYVHILIELKPTISDDFPAVLRQMKSAKQSRGAKKVLVVGSYTGIGATQEQFVQFMANEGIHVIFAE